MKVLFITNIPAPYRVDFFNELGKKCDLTVIFEGRSIDGISFNWNLESERYFKTIFLNENEISEKNIYWNMFKYIDKNKYDLIIMGGYMTFTERVAIFYMKIRRIQFVLSVDGGLIRDDDGWRRKIKSYLIGSAFAWLSTGENTTDYLLHYGARKEKIYTYPFTSLSANDIIAEKINRDEKIKIRKSLDMKEEKIIVAVGRFIYGKGYDVLLRSCEKINSDIGVYIIGGKPIKEYVEIIGKLKLKNIYFIDFKSKEDLKNYYKAADVFVHPTREDVWGLVINEAMSCGLPVITTDRCVAGLELIENGINGFIVKVGDDIALAERINDIMNDDSLKEKMSENNLKKIRVYTIESMAEKHIDFCRKIF